MSEKWLRCAHNVVRCYSWRIRSYWPNYLKKLDWPSWNSNYWQCGFCFMDRWIWKRLFTYKLISPLPYHILNFNKSTFSRLWRKSETSKNKIMVTTLWKGRDQQPINDWKTSFFQLWGVEIFNSNMIRKWNAFHINLSNIGVLRCDKNDNETHWISITNILKH